MARLSVQLRALQSASGLPEKAIEEWVAKRWQIPLCTIGTPIGCAALVAKLPARVESVEFAVFMDDEDGFAVLAEAPHLKHLTFSEPAIGTGEPWPVWSDAAVELPALETLTWRGAQADLTFVKSARGFDRLQVFSKSSTRARVTMKHPASRVEHHVSPR